MGVVRSWNIETGQVIQQFDYITEHFLIVTDQYLIAGDNFQITVRDLQTKEIKKLSNGLTMALFTANNKIISISGIGVLRFGI